MSVYRTISALSRADYLSAFADSPYAQLLRGGFRSLLFPRDVEKQYCQFHLRKIRSRIRAFLALAPIALIFQSLDRDYGALSARQVILDIAPFAAFLTGFNVLVWTRYYWKLYLPSVSVLAAALLLACAYSLPRGGAGDGGVESLEFALNVPILSYLLLGLPFYRGLIINLLCAVVFFASALQDAVPHKVLLGWLYTIPDCLLIAAVIAYTAERASRKHFLQEQLLGEIAARDPLTGLQNRGAFDSHLETLWKRAQHTGETVGLLILDIDHFKACNDTRGHQAGDECLRSVAQILRSRARRTPDLAARYGGEEFAIVLFNTTQAHLLNLAEAVRAQVENLALPNPGCPRKVVTISIGAAIVVPSAGRSIHGLIQRSDEALYVAKSAGRNCVKIGDTQPADTRRFARRNFLRAVS